MKKIQITPKELADDYARMRNKDLCKKLGITLPTLISYLKKYKIPLKGNGNRMTRPPRTKVIFLEDK